MRARPLERNGEGVRGNGDGTVTEQKRYLHCIFKIRLKIRKPILARVIRIGMCPKIFILVIKNMIYNCAQI
jgi:hypothetical protein